MNTLLSKNLKSEILIWDASTEAHFGSGKARHTRFGTTQNWVEYGLYEGARVVGASPFYNYQRRALKRRRTLANARRLLLEGGDTH
jgi:hypothetical protein